MIWRAGKFTFRFPRPAMVMGVINITPDSFSDGGRYFEPEKAADRARELIAEGADIIDIGGESTRPQAEPVSEAEELRRVIPVLERLRGISVPISIDTYKAAVARVAADAGAAIVNDVGASPEHGGMWALVQERRLGYVTMHIRGTPQTMQSQSVYGNITAEVADFLRKRLIELQTFGVNLEQVALDPGIGFAKTPGDNLTLLRNLGVFKCLARPLLLGISRKSFIGKITHATSADRLPGSLAGAVWAVQNGAQIIRAHDVGPTVQALRMVEAILNENRECSGES
jgi:dihydropteroate synthase